MLEQSKLRQQQSMEELVGKQTIVEDRLTRYLLHMIDMHMKRDATNLKVNYIRDREVTK